MDGSSLNAAVHKFRGCSMGSLAQENINAPLEACVASEGSREPHRGPEEVLRLDQASLRNEYQLSDPTDFLATIIHEVRQPITSLLSSANAARRWLSQPEPNVDRAQEALKNVSDLSDRIGELLVAMHALTGGSTVGGVMQSVGDLIATSLANHHSDIERDQFQADCSPEVSFFSVFGSKVLLEQLLMNIFRNAAQAMKDIPECDRKLVVTGTSSERYVTLSFSDNGHGLSGQDPESLFQPYLSTRSSGAGLGLTICRYIATIHRGTIQISNRQDQRGATVTVSLPYTAE